MNGKPLLTPRNYFSSVLLLLLLAFAVKAQTTWDFETGNLRGWTKTGDAFDWQPTFQDNVRPRQPTIAVNHQGLYWIGTFESRPNSGVALGTTQGDGPQGTLTSNMFTVRGSQISLLVGGGRDLAVVRVELLILSTETNRSRYENVRDPDGNIFSYPRVTLTDGTYYQIHANAGRNAERMERVNWPVRELRGEQARIRIVDHSSGSWGHINIDDIRFDREGSISGTPGDVSVTGIEVTQVIQVFPGNEIPLISNKPTMVRVYVSATEDTRGRWEDISGNLIVRRRAGGAQIGATVRPYTGNSLRTITVSPGGSTRRRFDDSLNFLLHPEQTTEGERELEVEIFSVTRRPESHTDNNRLTRRVRFDANQGFAFFCLSYGYSTTPDAIAPPFSDFEPHRAWAQAALPLSNLWALPFPGYPIGNIAHRQVRNADGTMSDAGYEDGRAWAHRMIDFLVPSGGSWIVVMQPEVDQGHHGAHYVNGVGNHVINMQSNYADPGPTLAHEIGHGFGQPHTWENSSFPHPDGRIGSQVGVRLFRGGAEIMNDPTHHDLMSYTHPQWLSPYTYTEILRQMTVDRFRVPPRVRDARWRFRDLLVPTGEEPRLINAGYGQGLSAQTKTDSGKSREHIYVSGWIFPDGNASFLPFEKISFSEKIASPEQGSDYSVTVEDSEGKTLAERSFNKPLVADEGAKNRVLFSMYLTAHADASRVTLRDKAGKILTERKVSANHPVVTDLTCKCEQSLQGKQIISWKGSDDDQDALTYSVWYSRDAGEKWIPLQIDLSETSLEFDAGMLAGSDRAMFRVLATDGFNTTEVKLPQTYKVAQKAPQVTISPVTALQTTGSSRLSVAGADNRKVLTSRMQTLLLTGSAFDIEDGVITNGGAFRWSSNKDGSLGTGSWIVLSKLSPGTHRITLSVNDSTMIAGRAFVDIVVN